MTRYSYKNTGSRIELEIRGHAGYSSAGYDIVCAGISALTFGLIKELIEQDQKGNINLFHLEECKEDPHIVIIARDIKNIELIESLFSLVLRAFEDISIDYPDYIKRV